MATYTTLLKTLIDSGFKLALDDYPIFDENYRETLNNKIINHYMYSEIGFETATLFNHYLRTTMFEIMPYYNKMYQSELMITDPLLLQQTESTHQFKGNETANNTRLNVYNETPQGLLNQTEIDLNSYATNYNNDTNNNNVKTDNNDTQTNKIYGNQNQMVSYYRQTLVNIDMMIIEELKGLFMSIYPPLGV